MTEPQINVAGMPEFDALLDHIYEYGTASEGIIDRANAFARALLSRYGAQPAASATQVGTWEPDDPRWFIWNPGIVRDSFPAGTPIYVGQPAASAEPVAQVSRKGFHRGSIVWTAAGLVADLPDGTNLYAVPVAAQAQAANADAWKAAVDHELTALHSTADSFANPREAVRALIDWHISVERDRIADLEAELEERVAEQKTATEYARAAAQVEAAAGDARDREDAERYRLLRRKVRLAGGEFHILNLDPRYIAQDSAAELDAAIDHARRVEGDK